MRCVLELAAASARFCSGRFDLRVLTSLILPCCPAADYAFLGHYTKYVTLTAAVATPVYGAMVWSWDEATHPWHTEYLPAAYGLVERDAAGMEASGQRTGDSLGNRQRGVFGGQGAGAVLRYRTR